MPAWLSASILAITLLVMIVGLFGLIVPIFPGIIVIWLAALGYGLVTGFTTVGWIIFGVNTVLMLIGVTIDNVLMSAKAHKEGAVGGVLGTILFPPIGGILAAPLVVLLLEYLRQRDIHNALRTVRGLLIGWGASFIVRFFIGLMMIGIWLAWVVHR
jgi:uncharacterized protein YqgC (DUF456 family)